MGRRCTSSQACASYGALAMGLSSVSASLSYFGRPQLSAALVHAAAALHVGLALWFVCRVAWLRAPPLPFWFPITTGVGMSAVSGAAVEMAYPHQARLSAPLTSSLSKRRVTVCTLAVDT